jgi:toxin ParE1/3/4
MPSAPKRLVWATKSEQDIREIWSYYAASTSADAANKVVASIRTAAERIGRHPFAGRPRDELRPGIRSVVAGPGPYLIFYRLNEDAVQISRIIHGRRDLDTALSKRD